MGRIFEKIGLRVVNIRAGVEKGSIQKVNEDGTLEVWLIDSGTTKTLEWSLEGEKPEEGQDVEVGKRAFWNLL